MRGNIKRALGKVVGALGAGLLVTGAVLTVPLLAQTASAGVKGAAFTANDFTGGGHSTRTVKGALTQSPTNGAFGACLNGHATAIDCNIYPNKFSVWLNSGPASGKIGPGTYFFAVLKPGTQKKPNDTSTKNLSFQTHTTTTTGGPWTDRLFTIKTTGIVTYKGSHGFDTTNGRIQLWPYAKTPNHGGVYVLAICAVTPTAATPPSGTGAPGVSPTSCKYDAFKVELTVTPTTPLTTATQPTVVKNAAGTFAESWTWTIAKNVTATTVKQSASAYTFHYTVTVTHSTPDISAVTVTGTVDVTNPNTTHGTVIQITTVSITDTLSTGTKCTFTSGGTNTQTLTGVALTATNNRFTYTCTLTTLPGTPITNTARATWPRQILSNTKLLQAGTAHDTVTVGFTGTITHQSVTVTDTVGGHLGTVTAVTTASPVTFHYTRSVTVPAGTCKTFTNTASLSTTLGHATKSTKLCVGADLTVKKTAAPIFTRTYFWTVKKLVTGASSVTKRASSVTFNYTVAVKQTGVKDSGWAVSGKITVTNPNNWESIVATVTDSITGGGTCKVTGGSAVTIPATGTKQLSYTCTFTKNPGSVTNTAKATWSKTAAFTPDGSNTGTATATFGTPTTLKTQKVTPTDAFTGTTQKLCKLTKTPTTYCTLTGTNASPFTSHTYKYTRTIKATPDKCVTYNNVAMITTGQTSKATATICGPVTGGLTMGFWQNMNGQGIILNGGIHLVTGTKVCNVTTFLRTYAPFQDLPAKSTCKQVAAYVYTVIKKANASGASMNSILKAQMLATALTVYFSSSAGGSVLKPTLGSQKVDLTHIFGSENTSSAFGGATCLTVGTILSYAASKSNAGGSIWYGQNKTTQGYAKDTFTGINNGNAFGC